MHRRTCLLSIALVAVSVAGCGGSSTAPPVGPSAGSESPNATSKGTVGYSALTLTNPFFQVIADSMRVDLDAAGYELLVVSADDDVKKQADQIDEFIVKGVSAIVLNPCDSQTIGSAIKKANAAGIPVFTNDIKYDGTDGQVVCHVATDNYQGGKLAGEALVKLIGESGGKVAIIDKPSVESCQMRVQGFTEVVDAHNAIPGNPQIEVVAKLDGNGLRDTGLKAAQDAIEANPDLTAVFAINDPSALGARAALEAAGKADQVRIIAFDGQPIGKQAILEGKIVCEPVQFPDRIGKTTIENMLKYFDGESVPAEILIPSELYYREDAEQDPELKAE